jgi:hypothetical protein
MLFLIPPPPTAVPAMGTIQSPFPAPASAPNPFQQATTQPELLHIPCPNGHELETPADMIGQEVLCPHCGVQFQLRARDSIEHKRRRTEEQARAERKLGRNWFNWAIVIAVLVILGIVFLIASSTTE